MVDSFSQLRAVPFLDQATSVLKLVDKVDE